MKRLRIFASASLLLCGHAFPLGAAPSGISPAPFVTALSRSPGGDVWLGTEDRGAFRWDAVSRRWQNFRAADGLGDDTVYTVAADRLGRVWFGTLNHGVSVYNGAEWRNFNAGNAPLGERVFDIQCSPADGDVWIATSAGLARYREADRTWRSYTRVDGLPADQAQCLAFNRAGDLFAGLQCEGIAVARAADGHRRWEVATAPWHFGGGRLSAPYPFEPLGGGLPGNQINALRVARDGTVWAGTCAGLAWSRDDGRSWKFLRGRDYAARVKGLYGGAPEGWTPAPKDVMERLLPEDYVTSLAEAADGTLWIGFRGQGCAALNPATGAIRRHVWAGQGDDGAPLKDGYINKLLAFPEGGVLAGGYGGGLVWVETPDTGSRRPEGEKSGKPPPLPSPAAAPDDGELSRMTARLVSVKADTALPEGSAVYLGEDWATQGDWLGRHGRRYARFCASGAPRGDLYEVMDPRGYNTDGMIGPHFRGEDAMRSWIHWITTDNPRTLYIPGLGTRRQAEWDDHGESYPTAFDGPDLWIAAELPSGTHRMTFYFFNKDGHTRNNRYRDYLLEVRRYTSALPKPVIFNNSETVRHGLPRRVRSDDFTNAIPVAVLARARVRDFWGGVYKTFAVRGPGVFYTRVARQGSHNAIVSAVMLEREYEPHADFSRPVLVSARFPDGVAYAPPDAEGVTPESHPELAGPLRLWEAARDTLFSWRGGAEMCQAARGLAFRAALARHAPAELIGNWRWELHLWEDAERRRFDGAMTERWRLSQENYPAFRSAAFRPYSPDVIPFSVDEVKEMAKLGVDWRQFIPKDRHGPVTLKDGEGIDWRRFIPADKQKEKAP